MGKALAPVQTVMAMAVLTGRNGRDPAQTAVVLAAPNGQDQEVRAQEPRDPAGREVLEPL